MNISLGTDHGGVDLREKVATYLKEGGHTVLDHGAFNEDSVDYPDYAKLVCDDITEGRAEYGLLICKSGIGMSISANKAPGIRAALVAFDEDAAMTRKHNNSNVLVLPGKHTTDQQAYDRIKDFISTEFEGGRHARRVDKMEVHGETCC
ncbi:MAG: ribose 5-phosphate isomerase B [Opitutales bacterium]|jgi:ribose 5-phosphate isomerase B|nr:ribose 5-phosphate isomerase B [bacterium]MDG2169166.1 ribose 5-phosphate isomerase B [Opitutales bacterium]